MCVKYFFQKEEKTKSKQKKGKSILSITDILGNVAIGWEREHRAKALVSQALKLDDLISTPYIVH